MACSISESREEKIMGITRSWGDGYSFTVPFGRVPLFLDLWGEGDTQRSPSPCFLMRSEHTGDIVQGPL